MGGVSSFHGTTGMAGAEGMIMTMVAAGVVVDTAVVTVAADVRSQPRRLVEAP